MVSWFPSSQSLTEKLSFPFGFDRGSKLSSLRRLSQTKNLYASPQPLGRNWTSGDIRLGILSRLHQGFVQCCPPRRIPQAQVCPKLNQNADKLGWIQHNPAPN